MRRGQISHAKVRAMVRVATSENESTLIEQAMYATAGKPTADRYLRQSRTASGMLRIVMQVHPDEGEMLLEAVRAARAAWRAEEKEKRKRDQQQQQGRGGPPDSGTRPDADVPDDSAESSEADVSDGTAASGGEPEGSPCDSAESSARASLVDALLLIAGSFLERARRGDGPTARRGGESTQLFVHLAPRPRGDPGGEIAPRAAEVRIDGEGTSGIARMNRAAGLEIDADTCCVGADPWLVDPAPAVDDLVGCTSASSQAGDPG